MLLTCGNIVEEIISNNGCVGRGGAPFSNNFNKY